MSGVDEAHAPDMVARIEPEHYVGQKERPSILEGFCLLYHTHLHLVTPFFKNLAALEVYPACLKFERAVRASASATPCNQTTKLNFAHPTLYLPQRGK
jgi:hypothetical protein